MNKFLLLLRKENTKEENDFYIHAIEQYGGKVLFLSDQESIKQAEKKLAQVEGVLLPGGESVGRLDFFLIEYTLKNNIKLLGICQGMQSMALFHTNNKLLEIGSSKHKKEEGYCHFVFLKEGRLKTILKKEKIAVNSHHCQTILESKEFEIVGRSEDGLIEALENKNHPFQIGVQWHPERMLSYDENSKRILEAFVCNKK